MQIDPRTVAREIPGLFDVIFPQLTPGVVAHFNRTAERSSLRPLDFELVGQSKIQKSMLFELGFVIGERLLDGQEIDWASCTELAIARQRQHFDAQLPAKITAVDREIAEFVGRNLESMIVDVGKRAKSPFRKSPTIPGFQWIASGHGDFSVARTIIEVKCSRRHFSSSDYRQIAIYWLLSFAQAIEGEGAEWSSGVLLNPRLAMSVSFEFDELLHVISAGRTKVEILEIFSSTVGVRRNR